MKFEISGVHSSGAFFKLGGLPGKVLPVLPPLDGPVVRRTGTRLKVPFMIL